MNKEIEILYGFPVILTKDRDFMESIKKTVWMPGQIVLLPEDAILVACPIIKETKKPQ